MTKTPLSLCWVVALVSSCAMSSTKEPATREDGGVVNDSSFDATPSQDSPSAPPKVTIWVHSNDTLYSMDTESFELTTIGKFDTGAAVVDLAVTPNGTVYVTTGSIVYQVDTATAHTTSAVPHMGGNYVAMTFLRGGELLAAGKQGEVQSIALATGEITPLGVLSEGYGLAGDLVAVEDGTMFAIVDQGPAGNEASNNALITVDPKTLAVQLIGPIGYAGIWGAAFANGHVYAFTSAGAVIEIDRTTGKGELVKQFPEVSFYGAGVTPLVSID